MYFDNSESHLYANSLIHSCNPEYGIWSCLKTSSDNYTKIEELHDDFILMVPLKDPLISHSQELISWYTRVNFLLMSILSSDKQDIYMYLNFTPLAKCGPEQFFQCWSTAQPSNIESSAIFVKRSNSSHVILV